MADGTKYASHENGPDSAANDTLRLRLYIAGRTPNSVRALRNLYALRDEYGESRCSIEVVDIIEEPSRAREDQIVAVPALVRVAPTPEVRIIGDLSAKDKVMAELELFPAPGDRTERDG
jgi:circadian clock protein KaiB